MKWPRLSRGVWIPAAIILGVAVLVAIGLLVVYPRLGAKMLREKVAAKVTEKLGRQASFGAIDVSLGHAVIRDFAIRGPNDAETPLVHVERIDIQFDAWASLIGNVELGDVVVDGVLVTLRRTADGRDNVSDVIERLRADRAKPGAAGGGGRGARMLPASLRITRGKLVADDAVTGTTAIIGNGDATWKPGELVAQARDVTATTIAAPRASAATIDVRKLAGAPPSLAISGGELAIFPKLALSGIAGTVIANPDRADHFVLDLAGGYGGVPGNLWTAKGSLDSAQLTASLDLEAAKFQLDRLAPILEQTPVVDYKSTSVDTKLHLEVDRDGGRFSGELHLSGLNVGHPMIADKEVHDLDLTANVDGTFSRSMRRLELTRGDFVARGIPFSVTGAVARPIESINRILAAFGYYDESAERVHPETGEPIPRSGPGGIQFLELRFVIPPVHCQRVLDAIPPEMAPYMMGYKLRGTFAVDIRLGVDWADLDGTQLGGRVGIRNCKVIKEPEDSPKRLEEEFEHYVEVEQGQWISFVVGPTNEDFVPLEEISPYLIKSIMSTEDSAFYRHRGFITSEFRTALIKDLMAGRFKYGASSITMQMVKNVLLYREKTLARKLQELFLTWHVENTLTKDRILEIYFNVIEYGPGLYGIGPAARHYFGKAPKDLNPVEAAFFSSILPAPKQRYKQYCANTLTRWTDSKIKRILALMLKRERLTQDEYDLYSTVPLVFVKDGSETEHECMQRVKKAIKNARSTNPMKR